MAKGCKYLRCKGIKVIKVNKNIIFSCIVFVVVFLVAEIGVRIKQALVDHIPFTRSIIDFYDPLLGWSGKKLFGDLKTSKSRIMVLGDSFTQGNGVPEEFMYYQPLARAFNAELFVYGAYGFGTLQEYLVLDKYIDEVKPDLILLQFCYNDFINNSWVLEENSFQNNNLMIRPYLIDGKIEYRYPRLFGRYRLELSKWSRIVYLAFAFYDRVMFKAAYEGKIKTSEDEIEDKGLAYKPFADSKDITLEILKRLKTRAGQVPVIAMPVILKQPYLEQSIDVFAKAGIPFMTSPAFALQDLANRGVSVFFKDNVHWNEKGNEVAGLIILQEVAKIHLNVN
ncbi:MAG: SGNH/GDSL hydrolase family protein [Candidatus Omnitrophica bacterium]|nr:SGNH/GDSL hydrolase family protein [Candidatus Omnitrophota bacterium]